MKKVEKKKKRKQHLTLRAVIVRRSGKVEDLGIIAEGAAIKHIVKIGGGHSGSVADK